jgi:3-dehydroquinate dehydratase/shikimate dehydrogenase
MTAIKGPLICAVVGRTRHKMMQAEIQQAAKHGAKLIELRLDFLAKPPDYKRLLANKPCPLIATVRRASDGGRYNHPEEERQVLLRQAIVAGFDWIDLETDIIDQIPRFGKVQRIVSYHNLNEVPPNLEDIYKKMCDQDADLVKVAVTAQQPQDNFSVFKLLQNPPKPTIAIAMGDLGTCSRVLAAKFGAPYTYGAFNKERSIAPGILSFAELKKIYHYEQIRPDTEVFGVIGDPVAHSLSPLLHNQAFAHYKLNAVYVPFRVPRGDLGSFLKIFDSVPVSGYSVTIPHKEAAARLAIWKDPAVETIGAANTLIRSSEGWRAYNTDALAAMESLKAALAQLNDQGEVPFSSRTVLILGAGGVARAIAHMIQKEGANLVLTNRTLERGQKLAAEVGCRAVDWHARHSALCDVLINCTSVGMHPNLDESPVHNSMLKPGLTVFDTIYNPETTMLIREARSRGCNALTGVDMFIRQAAIQFRLFTGLEAPIDLLRQLAHKALSPVNLGQDDTRI